MKLRFQPGAVEHQIYVYRGRRKIGNLYNFHRMFQSHIPDAWIFCRSLAKSFLKIQRDDISSLDGSLEKTMCLAQNLENLTETERTRVKYTADGEEHIVIFDQLEIGRITKNAHHNESLFDYRASWIFDEDLSKYLELPYLEKQRGATLENCKHLARIRLQQSPKPIWDWDTLGYGYFACFQNLCLVLQKEDISRKLAWAQNATPNPVPELVQPSV